MNTNGMNTNGIAHRSIDTPLTPSVIPPRESLQALRQEVTELARDLTGDVRRLSVRSGDHQIEVEWSAGPAAGSAPPDRGAPDGGAANRGAAHGGAAHGENSGSAAAIVTEGGPLTEVRAPMVGCYYSAPAPDAAPFVRVGDEIEPGTTVAIIEAMKMMNHIVAEQAGVVVDLPVASGESVEYDQILVRLRPTGWAS